jgi:hypothetical protein
MLWARPGPRNTLGRAGRRQRPHSLPAVNLTHRYIEIKFLTNWRMSDTSTVNAQYSDTAIFTNENGHITNQCKVWITNQHIWYTLTLEKLCDKSQMGRHNKSKVGIDLVWLQQNLQNFTLYQVAVLLAANQFNQ